MSIKYDVISIDTEHNNELYRYQYEQYRLRENLYCIIMLIKNIEKN